MTTSKNAFILVFFAIVFLFILHGLRSLGESLDFQPLRRLEELRQLVLRHVDLAGVHELEDCRQVGKWDVFQDDDGVLGGVLLQQGLEVGAAGGQDHLVSLAALTVAGDGHVAE